jgi:ethanolamine utilization protein EutQ
MGKRLITAVEIREAAETGQKRLSASSNGCIVTPMAKDEADRLGVVLDMEGPAGPLTIAGATGGADASSASSTKLIREVSDRLRAHLPADTPMATLEAVIRDVVTAKLGQAAGPVPPAIAAQGVCLIDHQLLFEGENAPVTVEGKAWVAEAAGGPAQDRLTGGYMSWEKASFTRRLDQPEIAVVLEGELHLTAGDTSLTGKPGNMLYFPRGAVVTYNTPARVKLACVSCM